MTREHFDLNEAIVTGTVRRLWSRDGDVFARVQVNNEYLTVRLENGQIENKDVTLQPGDVLRAEGYLAHHEYEESLLHFLDAAKSEFFLDSLPAKDRAAWESIVFPRVNTLLEVVSLTLLDKAGDGINQARLEGIVARAWTYKSDRFLRLAVYDRWTQTNGVGKRGHPRRTPHYVSVLLPDGKADGREIGAQIKDRLRVSGKICARAYRQTLREALLRTGDANVVALMERLTNADALDQIAVQHESVHLAAQAVIRFTP